MSLEYYYHYERMLDEIAKAKELKALARFCLEVPLKFPDLMRDGGYRTMLAVLTAGRYITHNVPATKVRIGCINCGEIYYSETLPVTARFGTDFVFESCNQCQKFSTELDVANKLLYTQFGGLLNAD